MDSLDHQDLPDKKVTEEMTVWMDFLADLVLKVTADCPVFLVCLV